MTKISLPLSLTTVPECAKVRNYELAALWVVVFFARSFSLWEYWSKGGRFFASWEAWSKLTPAQRAVDSGLVTIHGQSEHSSKQREIGGDRRYWITFGAPGRVSRHFTRRHFIVSGRFIHQ